jgi:hypothetical protein
VIFNFVSIKKISFICKNISYKNKILWLIFSILLGCWFVFAIPLNTSLPSYHKLIIIATGRQNSDAKGSEVWINSVTTGNNIINPSNIVFDTGWELKPDDNRMLSYQGQPATLRFEGYSAGDLVITFASHPWSGQVKVVLDGNEQTVDLFSSSMDVSSRVITFKVTPTQIHVEILLFICNLITVSFFTFFIMLVLVNLNSKQIHIDHPGRWAWLKYACPLMLTWFIYLLAYWPGGMSADSFNQWSQMVTNNFVDLHPVFHTLTNWLITRFWFSPAAIALTQIVLLSIVIGWGLVEQEHFGSNPRVSWFSVLIFAILPSTGLMSIMLWKDVFYSISVVILSILIFKSVMSQGLWLQEKRSWISLGIVAALVGLYRMNGPVVSLGTLILLLVSFRKASRQLILAIALTLGLWIGIRGPVYDLLDVYKPSSSIARSILPQLIARYMDSDTLFMPSERSFLSNIRPEKKWPYDCYNTSPLFFDDKTNLSYLYSNANEMLMLSARLIVRNPQVFTEQLICSGAFVYRITQPLGSAYETVWPHVESPNNFGLISESKIPLMKAVLDKWYSITMEMRFNWIVWRVPFWGYLLFIGIVVYYIKSKEWRISLIGIPLILNSLPLVFIFSGAIFRYVFSTLLVSLLFSGPLLFALSLRRYILDDPNNALPLEK